MRRSASVFCFPAHDRITPKTVAKAVDGGFKAFPFFILFFSIIQKVNADGTTVFLVEQNANQALRIAHRGYVMENGRIAMEGRASDLLASEEVRKAYLGM